MAEERQCLNCGNELVGRIDKRFCDDQCRSTYYNRVNRDSTNTVRRINNILRKNRRILEELNPKGKAVVKKDDLLSLGFSFSYFTSIYETKTGKVYRFVYEYGYVELENHKVGLVIKEDWVS